MMQVVYMVKAMYFASLKLAGTLRVWGENTKQEQEGVKTKEEGKFKYLNITHSQKAINLVFDWLTLCWFTLKA